ncbi:MAG: phosphoribosylformylglycinamidine synthase subunit PurQ [Patescibacteria group bacterium]|jgi:phosphoribosylformylglycinamidine synthase
MSQIAIIHFPGTTGVAEIERAANSVGLATQRVLWHEVNKLDNAAAIILPAGFSYGDRIRPGVIAARSLIMQKIKQLAQQGKPVLGIGNGCQILIEAGLLPGVTQQALAGATALNVRKQGQDVLGVGLYHEAVYIKMVTPAVRTVFTNGLTQNIVLAARVADGAGRFLFPETLLTELEHNHQIVFKYCVANGTITNEFPANPNGAIESIAGICNPAGNILGYIPEIEREETGTVLMAGLRKSLEQNFVPVAQSLHWQSGTALIKRYQAATTSLDIYVTAPQLVNQAAMAEQVLQQLGYNVTITCKGYWEIWHNANEATLPTLTTQLVKTNLLVNATQEQYELKWQAAPDTVNVLVRDINDYTGKLVTQKLHLNNVLKGTIWELHIPASSITERMNIAANILQTYLLYNPYSQDCQIL